MNNTDSPTSTATATAGSTSSKAWDGAKLDDLALQIVMGEVNRGDVFEKLDSRGAFALETLLDSWAVTCAQMSAYLGVRLTNGCGDGGHIRAERHALTTGRKVRDALGFATP